MKYRIVENGEGKFYIQRSRWFLIFRAWYPLSYDYYCNPAYYKIDFFATLELARMDLQRHKKRLLDDIECRKKIKNEKLKAKIIRRYKDENK